MEWCEVYSQTVVKKHVYLDARRILQEKLSCGRVILVTASIECYVIPIAQALGIDEVICTKLERDSTGAFTGRIEGANCYGEEKVNRLKDYLGDQCNGSLISAYSDHQSDLPLLKFAAHGYAINPSAQLADNLKHTSIRVQHWH